MDQIKVVNRALPLLPGDITVTVPVIWQFAAGNYRSLFTDSINNLPLSSPALQFFRSGILNFNTSGYIVQG